MYTFSKVTVYGTHDRGEVVWDTSKEPRNRNASSNALHTIWDAKFQRDGHVIHNKELAILNFALTEVGYDHLISVEDIFSTRGTIWARK